MLTFSMGPLKGLLLRLAKTRPGEGGGLVDEVPKAKGPSLLAAAVAAVMLKEVGAPARTRRMLEGNVDEVGVAGRTLMLLWGLLVILWPWPETETAGEAMDADDVDDALECEWWWCGMLRIEDTEDEVDFRPRRPPEERRYEERGVSGAGEAESRRTEPEPLVDTRGRGVTCVVGGAFVCVCTDVRFGALRRRLESGDLLSGSFGLCPLLAFELGDRARFDVSFIQFLSDKR